jgi:hypothetical protein
MYQRKGMSGELYDVLVLGPVEATPTAEARLATALAGLNGASLMAVAQGLSEKSLSMGQALDRVAAEALVRQLQSLGALTSIRRANPAFPQSGAHTPPPQTGFRAAGTPASGPLQGLTPGSAPGSGAGLSSLGPPPSSGGSLGRAPLSSPGHERAPGSGQGLRPLGSLRPETAGGTPAPTLPPAAARVPTDGLGHRVPTGMGFTLNEPSSGARGSASARPTAAPQPAPPPAPPGDPFSTSDGGAVGIELDRDRKVASPHQRASASLPGASGLNTQQIVASKSASGLDLAGAKQSTVERCSRHGLLYDTSKSSACRKCLGDGRAALAEAPGTLRSSPARRALLGLLFALVLGFLPAAYYARVPGAAEVATLRAEQQELSRGLGNAKTMQRFDEIEELVLASRRVSMRNTLIIWIAASGVLMVAWYLLT